MFEVLFGHDVVKSPLAFHGAKRMFYYGLSPLIQRRVFEYARFVLFSEVGIFVALKDAPVTAFGAGCTEYTGFAGFGFVLLESSGFGLIVVPCSVAAQYFSSRTGILVFLRMVSEMIQVKIGVWGVRSEERRVGKECRARRARKHEK